MSKRILVVEDQPDNRQIIRDMLAPTDYEITEAENGEQALAAIAKQRPDLILMDIQTADHGRLYGHETDQGRSGIAIDPDHCGYVLCAQRRGRRREWLAAMITFRNPSAHANCWQKFANTSPSRLGIHCCGA
jgi:CheY-like chemotaxis protein